MRSDAIELDLPLDPGTLRLRVGIATGEVVAGSVGTVGTRSFTVVGDTVNVAARLKAANKELGTSVAVNATTAAAARGVFRFRPQGSMQLRGRARPEPVFALDGRCRQAKETAPASSLPKVTRPVPESR